MYEYTAVCTRLIGPLTLACDVDLGFNAHLNTVIRLDAIQQPTRDNRGATIELVEQWLQAHTPFTLRTYENKREKFGRYVGVALGDDGSVLNSVVLGSGLVEAFPGSEGEGEHGAPPSHLEIEAEASV